MSDCVNNESVKFDYGKFLANPLPGEEIVISGMSGIFPDSYNIHHFRDNLYNKVDMVSSDNRRWKSSNPEVPQRTGKVFDIEKFDAGFFGLHARHTKATDPMVRLSLERAVEAVIDAGINPAELKGTKTGVFVGACFSENEKTWYFDIKQSQGSSITGNERSMIANRISFYLKLAGPSFVTDTACSSSLYALEEAYKAIRSGSIEMAIVGGTNMVLHPMVSLQFMRLGVLSKDGCCKVFDEKADGYARSEAISCIFLQKARDARRIYAQVVHAKTNCDGYKPQSITYPSGETQMKLLYEFYQECEVKPSSLSFLEAHGTGTQVGDPEELQAIDNVLCKDRTSPLLVGSVKSNIGHTEPTSGLCSIVKSILGYETGLIPPNIHYKTARKGIEALEKGRLQVIAEPTPFQDDRGLIGVNSFGFGGGNAHILLRWNKNAKVNFGLPKDEVPRLVCVSGRLENSVDLLFNDLISRKLDVELVKLYQHVFSKNISGHYYRSYIILAKSGELKRSKPQFCECRKQLALVFTNFGKSHSKIANMLRTFPLFVASVQRIHDILSTKNINITDIVLNNKPSNKGSKFDQMIATTVLQIAITDILKVLDINCDISFGTGVGEYVGKYSKGDFTLNETLLTIYNDEHLLKTDTSKTLHLTNLEKDTVLLEIGNQIRDISNKRYHFMSFGHVKHDLLAWLEIFGKLYQFGQDFYLDRLYPEVQYPVSRGTPMISPLFKWDHRNDWFVSYYEKRNTVKTGERIVSLTLLDDKWSYISGHMIDGRNLFPASGYVQLVWETFAIIRQDIPVNMKIVMENFKFLRATTFPKETKVELTVMVQRGSGNFEVIEHDSVVASGRIRMYKKGKDEQIDIPLPVEAKSDDFQLTTKDVYKELRLRGYNYKGAFRRIVKCNSDMNTALINWDSNWITFLDSLLQLKILQNDSRGLFVPTEIKRLIIDAPKHTTYVQQFGTNPDLPVYLYQDIDVIKCGGIEIRGIMANSIVRRKPKGDPVLEKYEFVSNETELNLKDSVRVMMQLILENLPGFNIKVSEVIDDATERGSEILSSAIHDVLSDLPLIRPIISLLTKDKIAIPNVNVEDKKLIVETDCTLVIGTNLCQRIMNLSQAFGALKDNGFVLSREALSSDFKEESLLGIDIIAVHTLATEKLYLLRKNVPLHYSSVIDITGSNESFSWLETLQKAIKRDAHVLVVAQNEPLSGILGLINCIRREPGCSDVQTIFTFKDAPPFDINDPFYSSQLKKNLAVNIFKNGKWGTYRHLLLDDHVHVEREHCFVNAVVRGDLSSLNWLEGPLTQETVLPPERDLVYVYYSALNFRDVMTASGRISADVLVKDRTELEFVQGFEFSGRTKDGRRMFGIASAALTTLLSSDRYFIWPCPDFWSLEDAATVPVVYSTVYCAFFHVCDIRKGKSILIHAGSGGIGQAAIRVALYYGLQVFTTVGTKEKREFIKKNFPQLKDNHIGNSRDISFEHMVHRETGGRGVDFVLNSLAEEKLLASVRCLARGGHFLEIGKFDLASNNELSLKLIQKGATFHGIMVDGFFSMDPKDKKAIHTLIREGINDGAIKPLVRTIFKMDQIEQAFRYMAAGKHIGKVLIQIRLEETNKKAISTRQLFKGLPRYCCNPDHVYIIIGGLGGFGLELADWLILRGARNLVLTSRKGIKNGYQSSRIKIWKSYGAHIYISTSNVTTKDGCKELIEEAASFGPIDAIFNLAVVLADGIFQNQTAETFTQSFEPKAFASKHLDEITRILCPNLRDFVIFSSVSCGRGNAGQSNYGMANSIMERICEKRRDDGLPALAIEWGAIGDVGLVADLQEEHTEMEIGGTLQQRISNCLQVLDTLLVQKNAIVSSMVVAEKRGGFAGSDNCVEAVANILGLGDLKTVSLHASLSELGMDSMTAVEIKQTLEREYSVFLTPHDIRTMTFAKLKEIQEERASEDESVKKDRALGGLDMIVRLITDEKSAKIPVVRLKSRIEDKDSGKNLVFLPGIEGTAKVLATLAMNLGAHVHCLQFISENQCDTIPEMAESLLPLVEKLISKNEPFNIAAYSYGALIGFEIVSMLEAKGYSGNLFAIDGAPDMLEKFLKTNLNVKSEAIFQTEFLMRVMSLYMPMEIILKSKERMLLCKTFEERLNLGEEITPKNTVHSIQYLRAFTSASYTRLRALSNYEISYPKIKSTVRLFKPQNTSFEGLREDYKLSEICEKPVDVKVFRGNHVTFLENIELAEAMNSVLLAEAVSETFRKETILYDDAGRMKMPEIEVKQI